MIYVKQSNGVSMLTHNVYITSCSKIDKWWYRKWSDNTFEAYMHDSVNFDTANRHATEIPNIFMTLARESLPFNLSCGCAVCSADWMYSEWAQSRLISKNVLEIRKFGNTSSSSVASHNISCYIIGKAE